MFVKIGDLHREILAEIETHVNNDWKNWTKKMSLIVQSIKTKKVREMIAL